jgi:hypothetical protein
MRTTHRVRRAGLALVALLLVLATACSDNPERADTESISADDNDNSPAVETEEAPPQDVESEVAETEPATAQEPPGEPLASLSVPISYIDGGELDIEVTGIEVAGELMRVSMTFTATVPTGTEPVALGAVLIGDETFPGTAVEPEVIDPVNLKAYEVVAGQTDNGTSVDLEDGVPQTLVFYFAAPQDDVDAVDIVLSSQTPPITDVPFPQ